MKADIKRIISVAREAGSRIMEIYGKEFDISYKDDNSPLTEADKASNIIITERLNELYPGIPILSEEGKKIPYSERKAWEYFWLVDPLDGSREFIKKNGEFTVNIALIRSRKPVLGVVYAPASQLCYFAEKGKGSFRQLEGMMPEKIFPARHDKEKLVVVASKSHLNKETKEFIGKLKQEHKKIELMTAGSALKLCLIAEGKADIYPRLGPTMEWDTAAGHVIVNEAGRKIYRYNSSEELEYNKQNLVNNSFVAK